MTKIPLVLDAADLYQTDAADLYQTTKNWIAHFLESVHSNLVVSLGREELKVWPDCVIMNSKPTTNATAYSHLQGPHPTPVKHGDGGEDVLFLASFLGHYRDVGFEQVLSAVPETHTPVQLTSDSAGR